MSYESLSLGAMPGVSRFSGVHGRTADTGGRATMRYPSPFFDIGQTYLPKSQRELLWWCRYYYLVNPLINATIHKMSEYPVTEIVIDEKNPKWKEKWEELLGNHLRYRAFQIEVGLDYYTYGMCFVTIHFPFDKMLGCPSCKKEAKAKKTKYKWRDLNYVINCKCGYEGPAKVRDHYVRDVSRIRLIRWNPENVNIDKGAAGAEPIYTFSVPKQDRNDVVMGKKAVLDSIPDVYIEAMKRNKFIRFSEDNLFVLKRPKISDEDSGWGMPLIYPVLKDTYYLQILRKAQEAIAQEHIVPMRVLYPAAGGASADPYTTSDLGLWKNRIENEISRWRYDNNYIPILPLPMGYQSIGGEGRALSLHQEMKAWSEQIIAGMGVPIEFVYGGMQYSGSNVSMRMLENMFIGYRTDHHLMLNQFVIAKIAAYMGWPRVKAHMRRFKMADDLQRTAFLFQLNQAQKISDMTLLQEADQDPVVEDERKKQELNKTLEFQRKMQMAAAENQGQAMLIQAKYQAEAAKIQQAAMPQQPGVDPATGQPMDPAAAAGGDPMAQQGQGMAGAEGEMVPGQQVDPGMPQGSTVSMENAQTPPDQAVPTSMQSPLTMGMKGGGANLVYLATRAASELQGLDDASRYAELGRMQGASPQLYQLVIQVLNSRKGGQANPLDPTQSPLPQQKPSRRSLSVGV